MNLDKYWNLRRLNVTKKIDENHRVNNVRAISHKENNSKQSSKNKKIVESILKDVKKNGDIAVKKYEKKIWSKNFIIKV